MKLTAIILTLGLLVWAGWAAPAQKQPGKQPAKKASTNAKSPVLKKPPLKGSAAAPMPKKGVARNPKAKSGTRYAGKGAPQKYRYSRNSSYQMRQRANYAPVQQQPTSERYRDIQQALIQRGYLNADAAGQWGVDSTAALKRFQQDQNLEASGKLDSLSLIALGLGPQRTTGAQARPQ